MTNPPDVFCYGEIGLDNIIQADRLPTPEIAVFPHSDSYHVGGAAANSAIWLAHMGLNVRLAGNHIGSDLYGSWLWQWLNRYPNIDLSLVECRENTPTPFTRAIVTPDGERSFLIFHYPQAPRVILSEDMLQGARFTALDLYGGEERLNALKTARSCGSTTVISDVIDPQHAALPHISILINSASYTRDMLPGVDVRLHAARLQQVSGGMVITTDGSHAVHVLPASGETFIVHPPKVRAVDATGAGDAFRSGLMYGLIQGFDLRHSVCWGVAAGALKVQRVGAASDLPALKEIEMLAKSLYPQVS